MGVLQQTTKVLGVIPYAWGLGMAKEDGKDKATLPNTFFLYEIMVVFSQRRLFRLTFLRVLCLL